MGEASKYALIDEAGICRNVVVWSGEGRNLWDPLTPVLLAEDSPAGIGWTCIKDTWAAPVEEETEAPLDPRIAALVERVESLERAADIGKGLK